MSALPAAWPRLIAALGPHASRLRLRPGIDDERIVAAEGELGLHLPDDYRAFLQIADGQQPGDDVEGLSLFPGAGAWFASLERVLEEWRHERTFDLERYDDITETQDGERIGFFVFHPRRIAIAGPAFLDGGNLSLDLIPGPRGTSGQLIESTSECDFEVLGDSLGAYIDRVAALVEARKLVPTTNDFGYEILAMPDGGDVRRLIRGERQRRT